MNTIPPGTTVDRKYVVRREIGRGGMCVVYSAEHVYSGRPVAVKLPRPDHKFPERVGNCMLVEARALERARHPNLVELLDAGRNGDGMPYLVMEMLDGRTLDGILSARSRLPVREALSICRQVCDALGQAHRQGVIHRDVKPSNIMIARDRRGVEVVKVIDFSIASIHERDTELNADKDHGLGELAGTPPYMALEQLLGGAVDARADIYGLAASLFECLCGAVPYPGEIGNILLRATTTPVPSVLDFRSDLPSQLADVIRRAMAKEPGERWPDAFSFGLAVMEAGGMGLEPTTLLGPAPAVRPDIADEYRARKASQGRTPKVEQRRRHERVPYMTPVRVDCADRTVYGRTEDLSEGGTLAVLPVPLSLGQVVSVCFSGPLAGTMIQSAARVQWVRESTGRFAVGLEYLGLPSRARQEICDFVHEHSCSDKTQVRELPAELLSPVPLACSS